MEANLHKNVIHEVPISKLFVLMSHKPCVLNLHVLDFIWIFGTQLAYVEPNLHKNVIFEIHIQTVCVDGSQTIVTWFAYEEPNLHIQHLKEFLKDVSYVSHKTMYFGILQGSD